MARTPPEGWVEFLGENRYKVRTPSYEGHAHAEGEPCRVGCIAVYGTTEIVTVTKDTPPNWLAEAAAAQDVVEYLDGH